MEVLLALAIVVRSQVWNQRVIHIVYGLKDRLCEQHSLPRQPDLAFKYLVTFDATYERKGYLAESLGVFYCLGEIDSSCRIIVGNHWGA